MFEKKEEELRHSLFAVFCDIAAGLRENYNKMKSKPARFGLGKIKRSSFLVRHIQTDPQLRKSIELARDEARAFADFLDEALTDAFEIDEERGTFIVTDRYENPDGVPRRSSKDVSKVGRAYARHLCLISYLTQKPAFL